MTIKIKYLSVVALAFLAAATSQAALTEGLFAYYDFEDLSNDPSAGLGPVATEVGTGSYTGITGGKVGKAAEFTGTTGDYISTSISFGKFGSSSDLGNNFTISAWYNLDTDATNDHIPQKLFHVFESAGTSPDVSYSLFKEDALPGAVSLADGRSYSEGGDNSDHFDDIHTTGTWQHVLQTYQLSTNGRTYVRTYIDGLLEGTISNSERVAGGSLIIGNARLTQLNRAFDGKIDEFAIWTRALNQPERMEVYNTGLNGLALTAAVVPEPSSALLLGFGGFALVLRRCRK